MAKFCGALLLVVSMGCVYAQTPDTAALRGTVTGPNGAAVAGTHVVIEDAQHQVLRDVTTGPGGSFAAEGLRAEAVVVRAQVSGLTATSGQITLAAGAMANVVLQLHVPTVHAEVVVTGAAGEVRTDEPQLGDRLTAAQMQATPLPNRRITYLPLLNAANRQAINQGDVFMNQDMFTANGTGRRQTWFEVDGANGDDLWGRQTIFTNVPLDAVSTMTVLENAFAADYGFGEGAVVNIVTRSGGPQFHGDVLGLWRPSAPEAKLSGFSSTTATSGNDISNDTLDQGAATFGGPLGQKTFFLGSGEYSYQDRASPVISPLAPGNYTGHYRDWMGFLRLDHSISQSQRVFLHLGADGFFDTNPNGIVGGNTLPSVARVFHRKTYTAELGDTAVLSPTMVNEARVQFQLASPITQFVPVIYGTEFSVPITSGGTFTSGTSQAALLMNRQFEAVDSLAKTLEKSELRVGFDVIHARNGGNSKEFGGPIYDGELIYKACTGTTAYCESSAYLNNIGNVASYTQSYGNADYVVDDTLAGVFGQWDVHPTSDLTLNAGLRYELQTFTDARKNFAPRVGFAYNLNGKGTTTFRGGFGIYYSQIVDNSEANYALTGPTGVFNYQATPGQPGFPASVSDVPLPALAPGAVAPIRSLFIRPGRASYYNQFFPTSDLLGYPSGLKNPYNEQWTLGLERQLASTWVLATDYVGSHTLGIQRPLDVDAPTSYVRTAAGMTRTAQQANCTRPYWVAWYAQQGLTCDTSTKQGQSTSVATPPYSVIQSDVNDGVAYYDALDVNLSHHARGGSALLASYTWSHAIDTVDPDLPSQNPNDPRNPVAAERGNAIFDQRSRLVLSGVYAAPWGISAGGIATLGGGLPYNYTTGVTNSGDTGATTDRPFINGFVVGRNGGRGTPIYDVQPFVAKRITILPERLSANLRAEAFNVLNHRNVVGFNGTWGNAATLPSGSTFGQPLAGITNQLPARDLQFSAGFEF
ncbi:MAG TPA: carboxypeptidase regulatory-like domain-containing protein [Acidobacteriaceae bacterium]|jgi:hypothetical protein|nr:carboxypeptidase regulatory-like domain-containing protein [Acidobacteriaceae bacterium]